MTPQEFDGIAQILKKESGLILTRDKAYLLESRLVPVARQRGLSGLDELVRQVVTGKDAKLTFDVVEAMTTNETFFFRDTKPFDQYRDVVMPKMLQSRAAKKSLRIWCAAASTGQEPYSLVIVLNEMKAKWAGWKIEIVGTDLSLEVLEKAKAGIYSQFEVQRGLPITLLVKYFTQVGENWVFDPAMRAMVNYRQFNLLSPMTALGQFDIVFCRNVLIYFDQETKGKVLDNISRQMPTDGLLFLGGAETVIGVTSAFSPVDGQRGLYRQSGVAKPGAPVPGAAPPRPAVPPR